jgi:hypothetical protein
MHLVTFGATLVLILTAAILFGSGLVLLYRKNTGRARALISAGFATGLLGVLLAVIITNIFNA